MTTNQKIVFVALIAVSLYSLLAVPLDNHPHWLGVLLLTKLIWLASGYTAIKLHEKWTKKA